MKRYMVCTALAAFLSAALTMGVSFADDRNGPPSIDQVPVVTIEPIEPAQSEYSDLINHRVELPSAMALKEKSPGDSVFFDVLLLRPAGAVACVAGLGASIISLPFALPTGSQGKVFKTLVADPFKYTFARPVGKLDP